MRVKVGGPFTTTLPNGTLDSPVPGSEITIDDADTELVAHWTMLAQAGHAEILEPAEVNEVKDAIADPGAADETKKAVVEPPPAGEKPAKAAKKAAAPRGGAE